MIISTLQQNLKFSGATLYIVVLLQLIWSVNQYIFIDLSLFGAGVSLNSVFSWLRCKSWREDVMMADFNNKGLCYETRYLW